MSGLALRFYYDVISPYAHVAWAMLPALAARHGRTIDLEPILFAGVLDALGTKGPAEVPARREYAFKDASRKAARAGLAPLRPPPSHPFNPLLALRVLRATSPKARPVATTALFNAVWSHGTGVADAATITAALATVDVDAAPLITAAASDAIKTQLRDATSAAIAAGAFGVPTVIARATSDAPPELFFGVDGLSALDDYLAGRDPIDAAQVARWRELPVAAVRPGARS